MYKTLKKFGALLLAVVMLLALNVTAFAAGDQDGTLADNGVVKKADHSNVGTTLNIPKGITVYGSLDKVYGPTVTYTYSIKPISSSSYTVTDFNNKTAPVKVGPNDGVTIINASNQVAFTSSEVTLSSGTAEVTENLGISVNLSKFNNTDYGPGIYRYVITDTTDISTLYAAGITRADAYNTTQYLDVYIKYNTVGTALEVYGYVLLAASVNPEGVDDEPLQWVTPTKKSSGFIAASETNTDEYHTIDVSLTKTVTGEMGNKNHEFQFTVAIANSSLNYYSGEVASTPSAVSQLTNGTAASLLPTLKDGDVFYIYGLNPKATVTYTETNNTVDQYTVTAADSASADILLSGTGYNSSTHVANALTGAPATAALAVSNYNADNAGNSVAAAIAATKNRAVTFTNNLDAISPTGVVLRIAPYVLILGAGFIFLAISKRRKEEADEA